MPIKDQCERCQHNGMPECPVTITPSAYDGHSCGSYAKKTSIDLSKPEDAERTVPVTGTATSPVTSPEPPAAPSVQPSDESPSGWLAFFLYFALPVATVVSLVTSIISCTAEDYGFADVVLSATLLSLAVLTIVRFVKHKPDAVILAKTYLIVCFVINLLALIGGELETDAMAKLIRSLISGIAWFWYMSASEQVGRIIPKASRKFTPLSKWVIGVFVAIPLLFIGYISSKTAHDQLAMSELITEEMLSPGECTDGKIIFTVPDGYEEESTIIEESDLKVFSLSNGEDVSYTLCCDYMDTEDFTQQEFDEYWENWQDDDLKDVQSTVDRESAITVKGNPAFLKVVKYYNEYGSVYWYYALVHHEITGKTAVVSSYRAESEYSSDFFDFLSDIKFYK